jgi:hypothetical protein
MIRNSASSEDFFSPILKRNKSALRKALILMKRLINSKMETSTKKSLKQSLITFSEKLRSKKNSQSSMVNFVSK